jgi:hypothetical protein
VLPDIVPDLAPMNPNGLTRLDRRISSGPCLARTRRKMS